MFFFLLSFHSTHCFSLRIWSSSAGMGDDFKSHALPLPMPRDVVFLLFFYLNIEQSGVVFAYMWTISLYQFFFFPPSAIGGFAPRGGYGKCAFRAGFRFSGLVRGQTHICTIELKQHIRMDRIIIKKNEHNTHGTKVCACAGRYTGRKDTGKDSVL